MISDITMASNLQSLYRVWQALRKVEHHFEVEFSKYLSQSPNIKVDKEILLFNSSIAILKDEEIFIPDEVFECSTRALKELQDNLNNFLDVVWQYTQIRKEGDPDNTQRSYEEMNSIYNYALKRYSSELRVIKTMIYGQSYHKHLDGGNDDIPDTPEPRVFVSYAREDKESAERLVRELATYGVKTWTDFNDLLPGKNWPVEIKEAIRRSDYFVALLSKKSIGKTGYVQKEVKTALEHLDERPLSKIYIIPVRLEECTVENPVLRAIQWVDLFPDWHSGTKKIVAALRGTITFNREYINYPGDPSAPLNGFRWRDLICFRGKASEADVNEHRAAFSMKDGVACYILDLPKCAIWRIDRKDGTYDRVPVLVMQQEDFHGEIFVGFRLIDGSFGMSRLNDLEILEEPNEQFYAWK
jgi:hypothetical protein